MPKTFDNDEIPTFTICSIDFKASENAIEVVSQAPINCSTRVSHCSKSETKSKDPNIYTT